MTAEEEEDAAEEEEEEAPSTFQTDIPEESLEKAREREKARQTDRWHTGDYRKATEMVDIINSRVVDQWVDALLLSLLGVEVDRTVFFVSYVL